MNFFKTFGDKLKKAVEYSKSKARKLMIFPKILWDDFKKVIKYLKSEAGDLMIYIGLFLLPVTTYQISKIAASYVLSAVLIIIGINIIRAKGGEK